MPVFKKHIKLTANNAWRSLPLKLKYRFSPVTSELHEFGWAAELASTWGNLHVGNHESRQCSQARITTSMMTRPLSAMLARPFKHEFLVRSCAELKMVHFSKYFIFLYSPTLT
jgi:hypothetical protein